MFVRSFVLATAAALVLALAPAATSASAHRPEPEFQARVSTVPDWYRDRMIGVSWKQGCPVPIDDLRIITMNHWGFDGRVHKHGRLMVHKDVARDVVGAFGRMFDIRFPIRRMELIEKYDGSDDASMAADNTSSFNCRPITGSPGEYSIHSYGKAIDINTVENPYVKGETVLPPAGADYLDRDHVRPGMITDGDRVVKAFWRAGFDWGGYWDSLQDYQHFEARTL